MKAIALVTATALLAASAASPAFAGGRSGGGLLTGVLGGVTGVVGGVTSVVSVGNLSNTLNGVKVLNNSSVLSGTTVAIPVSVNLSRNSILSRGLLGGGGGHGCGCN
ncbi:MULTISPECIES: hypothetical protein [unclassified Beijerinckia]|uniref:hypothetical protein n=1 Tax=unclassified Beijerinckia TaxID=2638183 RepID=UPI000897F9F9|nr:MULTISPECIES: hypothetical protein [unclassified Beijerinckia]MDH7795460.1 hypothetical protein [Beijerinckia sp. GAS462]SEC02515.1 hypothetical protein SAMN05443249_1735 [Beijerinckia sp. 28-YEA-48]